MVGNACESSVSGFLACCFKWGFVLLAIGYCWKQQIAVLQCWHTKKMCQLLIPYARKRMKMWYNGISEMQKADRRWFLFQHITESYGSIIASLMNITPMPEHYPNILKFQPGRRNETLNICVTPWMPRLCFAQKNEDMSMSKTIHYHTISCRK